ncbi:MAG: glycosyltransferase [Pseudomonadota bacterium]|nr:glycosyltransferase [Pseudomonadota bacterium]
MQTPYFHQFYDREPPVFAPISSRRRLIWQLFAGLTLGLGAWYIVWRWQHSINAEALLFSCTVALCETLALVGSALFFYDIWDEGDTEPVPIAQKQTRGANLDGRRTTVDVFITTFDEAEEIVAATILAAKKVNVASFIDYKVYLLDDGNRIGMSVLAKKHEVGYFARTDNRGFKAGNLANAIFKTDGDFFIVCDADTQLMPSFLSNTLGYFEDQKVSWVQTPHWFYDLPEGCTWRDIFQVKMGAFSRFLPRFARFLTGTDAFGKDHFLSNASLFFDVIQRRRNRNGASFCCGAASIHRREAVMENALIEKGKKIGEICKASRNASALNISPRIDLKPFEYHVSEDILTSIQAHSNGWGSVFHPQVEAKMLSPWTASAWAIQRLKYAGGTFDILLNANPIFEKGMSLKVKLHYLATFWSYLSVFFFAVLMFAPVWSLISGTAPVQAYSLEFFAHLIPVLVCNEIAMLASCKGYSHNCARVLAVGTIAIQMRAFFLVLLGRRPKFPPTPKVPSAVQDIRHALPSIAFLIIFFASVLWGGVALLLGLDGYSPFFVLINGFWILWSSTALIRMIYATSFCPTLRLTTQQIE